MTNLAEELLGTSLGALLDTQDAKDLVERAREASSQALEGVLVARQLRAPLQSQQQELSNTTSADNTIGYELGPVGFEPTTKGL